MVSTVPGIPYHPKPGVADDIEENRTQATAVGNFTAEPVPQAVRFASKTQEIEPAASLQSVETPLSEQREEREEFTPEAQAEFRTISQSIQNSRLHQGRMSNFAFEPISLPPSRVGTISQLCFKVEGCPQYSNCQLGYQVVCDELNKRFGLHRECSELLPNLASGTAPLYLRRLHLLFFRTRYAYLSVVMHHVLPTLDTMSDLGTKWLPC